MGDPIRLYTYAMSPYAAKVHCFLLYKGLDFECFYINPLRVSKDLPVGRQIPVVTVEGESRADSTPIGPWLDELFPDRPRLLPREGEERERLLVIDDWGLAQIGAEDRRDLLEILEDRYGRRSTVVASQLPVKSWYEAIGDPTLADGILDRLVHGAYRIALEGESMRKTMARRSKTATKAGGDDE